KHRTGPDDQRKCRRGCDYRAIDKSPAPAYCRTAGRLARPAAAIDCAGDVTLGHSARARHISSGGASTTVPGTGSTARKDVRAHGRQAWQIGITNESKSDWTRRWIRIAARSHSQG